MDPSNKIYRIGLLGGVFIAIGTIFLSLFAIFLESKQPVWKNAEVFVENYDLIQTLPFYFGLFLVGGSIMLEATIYLLSKKKIFPLIGLVLGIAGASIVGINYTTQTTFIPAVVEQYNTSENSVISTFTMGNPNSFARAAEMWGYGFIGLATWLVTGLPKHSGLELDEKVLFVLVGVHSIGASIYTALDLGWVVTTTGYIAFGQWNVL